MSRHSQYTPSLQSARPGTEAAAKARKGVRRATRVARAPKLRERTALGGVAGGANADAHASAASSASPARVIAERYYAAQQNSFGSPLMGFFFVTALGVAGPGPTRVTRGRSHKIENWYQPGGVVVNKGGPKSLLLLL